jgi:NADH-quinone oxidoreductase subunit N
MTWSGFITILPMVVPSAGAVAIMLAIAVHRHHLTAAALAAVALAAAFGLIWAADRTGTRQVTALFVVDRYALFFFGLLLVAALAVVLLAYRYLDRRTDTPEEFYILLLLATVGGAVLVASSHFASFFLGLELLSVSLYALIAYPREQRGSVEAGIKYLVLAAASAAFLLFGMALVYAELGTMEFSRIAAMRTTLDSGQRVILLTGLGMIAVGIGYKLAVVPFHMWTPDVYEGAPAPVTGFVASVSKGAMFALLLRFYSAVDFQSYDALFWVFIIISVASMAGGNLLALLQNNVKRILAYSSIAHLGYLLVAFLASGSLVVTAVSFYLVVYFVATLVAFGVVTVLSGPERDADAIEDYQGLFRRRPWLAIAFTASLLSLAGIPFTAGFVGKFYLVAAGGQSALWVLVGILVATSVVGLFYYLRVVVAMYVSPAPAPELAGATPALPLVGGATLTALTGVMIWLGVYPAPLIDTIQRMARLLT